VENRVCLSTDVQVAGATWWAAMRIVTGLGDLVQRTGDSDTCRVLGGRMIERSGDTVYGLHCTQHKIQNRILRCNVDKVHTTTEVTALPPSFNCWK
jgi:hypothetical protein